MKLISLGLSLPMDHTQALHGCQMVHIYFETKNPSLGKFGRALEWKRLVYSLAIWNILRTFGYLGATYVLYFPPFWYIVSRKIWQPC
jgi:hypothetical protein